LALPRVDAHPENDARAGAALEILRAVEGGGRAAAADRLPSDGIRKDYRTVPVNRDAIGRNNGTALSMLPTALSSLMSKQIISPSIQIKRNYGNPSDKLTTFLGNNSQDAKQSKPKLKLVPSNIVD
jgi:hypothetical protein